MKMKRVREGGQANNYLTDTTISLAEVGYFLSVCVCVCVCRGGRCAMSMWGSGGGQCSM